MKTKAYDFHEQLKIGEAAEAFMDEMFAADYDISAVDTNFQKLGVDRFYLSKSSDKLYLVEYKLDTLAAKTGNVYVETVSVDKDGEPIKLGWAHTSQADIIIYYILPKLMLAFKPEQIAQRIDEWRKQYRFVLVQNKDYRGGGILVPLNQFTPYCKVRRINV